MGQIRLAKNIYDNDEVLSFLKAIQESYDLIAHTKQMGQLLVVQFVVEGIVKPTKVALTMQMGCDGGFI
ncbi:hypothetical protein GBA52_026240 [Prunus armeniaca]|nr:hypothetical protein GBA52_026240 [Prunus armeniaca]